MDTAGRSPVAAHPSATPVGSSALPVAAVEGRGARARRPPAWSREPPGSLAEEKKHANQPLGRRKVAGSGSWHASQLNPEMIWKGHQAHWRKVKHHARAQYAAALGRHKPRLRALFGLRSAQPQATRRCEVACSADR